VHNVRAAVDVLVVALSLDILDVVDAGIRVSIAGALENRGLHCFSKK
jgi:hypothetical protein